MRDPNRIDGYVEKLKECWKQVPDWRFGQFMSNVLAEIEYATKRDIFYVEDKELFETMEKIFKAWKENKSYEDYVN